MKVNCNNRNLNTFTGLWNNKFVLKSLETISEHGTSFAAGTSLAMSLTTRPLAIFLTPDVEKENKQYACANSICSGLVKFAMVEALALPIENAVKSIDKNPEKYLNKDTTDFFKAGVQNLSDSKNYRFATQLFKLGTGLVSAIPKSTLTIALIPIIMDKLFDVKKIANKTPETKQMDSRVKNEDCKNIHFTGKITDEFANGIGRVLETSSFKKFIQKYSSDEKNIAKHVTAGTDILLTSAFAVQTAKSDKIKENRKKVLIYTNIISTGITLLGGYAIDRLIKNQTAKFVEKFAKINAGDAKLHKYIEGINILRPALIFATIYYGLLPMFSTYMAERIDKRVSRTC